MNVLILDMHDEAKADVYFDSYGVTTIKILGPVDVRPFQYYDDTEFPVKVMALMEAYCSARHPRANVALVSDVRQEFYSHKEERRAWPKARATHFARARKHLVNLGVATDTNRTLKIDPDFLAKHLGN